MEQETEYESSKQDFFSDKVHSSKFAYQKTEAENIAYFIMDDSVL